METDSHCLLVEDPRGDWQGGDTRIIDVERGYRPLNQLRRWAIERYAPSPTYPVSVNAPLPVGSIPSYRRVIPSPGNRYVLMWYEGNSPGEAIRWYDAQLNQSHEITPDLTQRFLFRGGWSPNGEWFAYVTKDREGIGRVVVVESKTGRQAVYPTTYDQTSLKLYPYPSNDGQRIALFFEDAFFRNSYLHLIDLRQTPGLIGRHAISKWTEIAISAVAWSADGAYFAIRTEQQLLVVRGTGEEHFRHTFPYRGRIRWSDCRE
jgi:hypothetical protein